MAGGLVAGYGAFASIAARYLYPSKGDNPWVFIAPVAQFKAGDSYVYRTPAGAPIAIARQGRAGTSDDFVALSSTCPHLGCQVHWEASNNRFFCPCHNGTFDPGGKATGGPPAEAGQSLTRYPLRIEQGRLYMQLPPDLLASESEGATGHLEVADAPTGPGHDPCLRTRKRGNRA